jgi:site-specific recombinase XerD
MPPTTRRHQVTTLVVPLTALAVPDADDPLGDAAVAAAAFLARYTRRTLDAYRHDLRVFFQWAATVGLDVLAATRPQIELNVRTLQQRGLAASTIDRRLSTLCGF